MGDLRLFIEDIFDSIELIEKYMGSVSKDGFDKD